MANYEDEEEFFDSDEGQRWLSDFDEKTRAVALSLRRMQAAISNVGYELSDMQFSREQSPSGASAKVTQDALARISLQAK